MDDLDFLRPRLPDHLAKLVAEAKEVHFLPCREIAATVEKTGRCTQAQEDAMRTCIEAAARHRFGKRRLGYNPNNCDDHDHDDPLLYDTWMFS